MIHHLSIAAREPRRVAEVLAEFMGGVATPFPINPGSWFAHQNDPHGTGVEVYPAGTELRPAGERGTGFAIGEARTFGPTHFALSIAMSPEAVAAVAEREGWPCFRCRRGPAGGGPGFHVMEVWIEGSGMIELLPPAFAAEYLAVAAKTARVWALEPA